MSSLRSPEFSPPPNTRKHKTSIEESQSNLETYDAQRKRQERVIESEQQRKERLTRDRLRKRTARESENENQRKIRLVDQRQRSATNQSSRSEQRSGHLINYRQRSKTMGSIDKQQSIRKSTEIVNIQRQQQMLEKEQQALLNQYIWPTTIPRQLKEYCLQDFSNHMSMPVLRQSTCIVCNIRAYANTMKECALQDIPNSDKLFLPHISYRHHF